MIVDSVIKRNVSCQSDQLPLFQSICPDGSRTLADVICFFTPFGSFLRVYVDRAFVWSVISPGNPQNKNVPSVDQHRFHDRYVSRLDEVAFVEEILLDEVQSIFIKPLEGESGIPVALLDAQHDVPAAQVVKIIGKSGYGMQNRRRIPVRLVFYAGALYHTLMKQFFHIDRNRHHFLLPEPYSPINSPIL